MSEQLSMFGDDKGKKMLGKAMKWRSENIRAWSQMKVIAHSFADEGRHFSIDLLVNEARFFMRTNGQDNGFKINNDIRAPLARLLIQEDPMLAPYIETRGSMVDSWIS